jgi:hypothetical protein
MLLLLLSSGAWLSSDGLTARTTKALQCETCTLPASLAVSNYSRLHMQDKVNLYATAVACIPS